MDDKSVLPQNPVLTHPSVFSYTPSLLYGYVLFSLNQLEFHEIIIYPGTLTREFTVSIYPYLSRFLIYLQIKPMIH